MGCVQVTSNQSCQDCLFDTKKAQEVILYTAAFDLINNIDELEAKLYPEKNS